MEASVLISIIALIGSLGGVYIANRYTAKTARDAQKKSAEIEERKVDTTSWEAQVKSWREDVTAVRAQRDADRIEYEQNLTKIQAELAKVRNDYDVLRRERDRDHDRIELLVAWSRVADKLLREASITYPPPPLREAVIIPPTSESA